jgi:two-component system, sensor histidine kinase PdtaS
LYICDDPQARFLKSGIRYLVLAALLPLLQVSRAQHDSVRAKEWLAAAWKSRLSDMDTAFLLTRKTLSLLDQTPAKQEQDWHRRARVKATYYLGTFYSYTGALDTALGHLNDALRMATANKDLHHVSLVNGGLGNFYFNQANFPEALRYYFTALALDEKRGYREGVSVRLSNIGTIYDTQKEYLKALGYYQRAIAILREMNDSVHISVQLGNIGIVYHELRDFAKARRYYLQALAIDRRQGNKNGMSRNLNNLGSIYQEEKQYDSAKICFDEGLVLAKEQGNPDLEATHLGNLGAVARRTADFRTAESRLKRAIAIAEEIASPEAVSEFEHELSQVYAETGRHREALEHFRKHIATRDSLFSEENTAKNVRLEMNYEFTKKEAVAKARHEEELLRMEAEAQRQKQMKLLMFIIVALTLMLLVILKRAYDNKKRLAEFLAVESDHKEALLQEVHHRVNNNFQIISSLLTLQENSSDNEKVNRLLQQSQGRIQSLSTLHELLYQKETLLDVNMRDYLEKVLDFHREVLVSRGSDVKITTNVSPVTFSTRVAVPVALIVNELVTNSIKYAFREGETGLISVTLVPDQGAIGSWKLEVSDNGHGMGDNAKTRHGSIGLRLVNMMAKQLKASHHRGEGPGTSFIFEFFVKDRVFETIG